MGPVIYDCNKRLILLSVIQLSGGHCKFVSFSSRTSSSFFPNPNFEPRGRRSRSSQAGDSLTLDEKSQTCTRAGPPSCTHILKTICNSVSRYYTLRYLNNIQYCFIMALVEFSCQMLSPLK